MTRPIIACGCFDLLHPGHIHLLNEAKAKFPDKRLVVGLGDDAYIRRAKNRRPYFNTQERAFMLQSLKSVDMVIPFDPYQNDGGTMDGLKLLLDKVKPTHYIRGMNAPDEHIHDYLLQHGIKLVLIPMRKGYSTTLIAKGIRP